MTDFAHRPAFARTLEDIGSFYRDYRRLMDHWKRSLDLPILDVAYEDVVTDLEGQTRRVLGFLGLPWDQRCLSFHRNRRPVGTASRDQVRRPIYRTSVGRGAHYSKFLGPLREALSGEA